MRCEGWGTRLDAEVCKFALASVRASVCSCTCVSAHVCVCVCVRVRACV